MSATSEFAAVTFKKMTRIREHSEEKTRLIALPSLRVLNALFDVLFFSSIKTDEGRTAQVRVFYVDPKDPDPSVPERIRSDRWKIFCIAEPVKLTVANLVKLANAADPWASGLAVFSTRKGGLFIWGMVDQMVHWSRALVQEADGFYSPPGAFNVVINGPADLTVLCENHFVTRLAQQAIIDTQNDCLWDGAIGRTIEKWTEPFWTTALKTVIGNAPGGWSGTPDYQAKNLWIETLSRILINIQRQRHGGAILFCPPNHSVDLLIKHQLQYDRIPVEFHALLQQSLQLDRVYEQLEDPQSNSNQSIPKELRSLERVLDSRIEDSKSSLTGAVRFVSSMSGVDGLILASPDFSIRGFGVEITTKQELPELLVSDAADLQLARKVAASNYGTRHRSMARFCSKHSSVGFVVSQDGNIRAVMRVGDDTVLYENVKVHWIMDTEPEEAA